MNETFGTRRTFVGRGGSRWELKGGGAFPGKGDTGLVPQGGERPGRERKRLRYFEEKEETKGKRKVTESYDRPSTSRSLYQQRRRSARP